jgi:predicted aldo/keto reductase-like oxidoreductase
VQARRGISLEFTPAGSAAFSDVAQDAADRTMELIIERGINHIDTAAGYGDSDLRLGPRMERALWNGSSSVRCCCPIPEY